MTPVSQPILLVNFVKWNNESVYYSRLMLLFLLRVSSAVFGLVKKSMTKRIRYACVFSFEVSETKIYGEHQLSFLL